MSSKTFCPVPWAFLFVSTKGSMLSCLLASSTSGKGFVRNRDGKPMNVNSDSIDGFRNSLELRQLRLKMLTGEESPEVCRRCIDEEKFGLVSRRMIEGRKNLITVEEAKRHTDSDGRVDTSAVPIANLNLRLGNKCNLSCGTCGPSQSSGWYEEWYATRHKGFRDAEDRFRLHRSESGALKLVNSPYEWFEADRFWQEIESSSGGFRELHFSGGEPLFSHQHVDLLERLVQASRSQEITLEYNTNLTVLPSRLTKLWMHFKTVRIGVSVDGVGRLNDYIRFPSQFKTIETNLHKLESLGLPVVYWATITVNRLNIGRLPEYIKWVFGSRLHHMNRQEFGEHKRFLSYHMLRSPPGWNVKSMPQASKALVRKRFEQFLSSLKNGHDEKFLPQEVSYIEEVLAGIVKFMDSEDWSDKNAEFLSQNITSDNYRFQNFSKLDPELWNSFQSEISL